MIDNLDEKTRIKLKYYLRAMDNVLVLQRKRWYGWKTVSWIYPSIMKNESCKYIREWLEWDESEKNKKKVTELDYGKRLMTTCRGKF
jgi:hypothetical protein